MMNLHHTFIHYMITPCMITSYNHTLHDEITMKLHFIQLHTNTLTHAVLE